MTEAEYKTKHYPDDFIKVGDNFFVLPQGYNLEIAQEEVASTFSTVDGHKRKDIIRSYESASLKYEYLLEADFKIILVIVDALQNIAYGTEKKLYIKKQFMPMAPGADFKTHFKMITIDTVKPVKYTFKTRKNGFFVYSGITLNLN